MHDASHPAADCGYFDPLDADGLRCARARPFAMR